MPKINCKCGNIISYGEIPNPHEWLIISDVEYDSFSGSIDSEELYKQMKSMLKCEVCGRIWIFWNGFQSAPTPYFEEKI